MVRIRVYPYKQGSKSAKLLADKLGGKVLKREGSKFSPREGDVIVNWGASGLPGFGAASVLNPNLKVAQNKLDFFKELEHTDVRTPQFWTDKGAIQAGDFPVCCRAILTGHSAAGLVIANSIEELVPAPLYTKYVKKKDEYRVHVFEENAFFIQRKAKKTSCTNPNWKIRNLAGGFAFVSVEKEVVPKDVIDQAILTLHMLGLEFGGVDVLWNDNEKKAYVLEVNTACGLEERTAEKYAAAILASFEAPATPNMGDAEDSDGVVQG